MTIGRITKRFFAVLAFIAIAFFMMTAIMAPLFYARGAIYQVNFGNISPEKCSTLISGDEFIEYIDTVWDTDPCTGKETLYFLYSVEWKADAKEWFINWLDENGVTALSIQSGNIPED